MTTISLFAKSRKPQFHTGNPQQPWLWPAQFALRFTWTFNLHCTYAIDAALDKKAVGGPDLAMLRAISSCCYRESITTFPVSWEKLGKKIKRSRPTAERIIRRLLKKGFITKEGGGHGSGDYAQLTIQLDNIPEAHQEAHQFRSPSVEPKPISSEGDAHQSCAPKPIIPAQEAHQFCNRNKEVRESLESTTEHTPERSRAANSESFERALRLVCFLEEANEPAQPAPYGDLAKLLANLANEEPPDDALDDAFAAEHGIDWNAPITIVDRSEGVSA